MPVASSDRAQVLIRAQTDFHTAASTGVGSAWLELPVNTFRLRHAKQTVESDRLSPFAVTTQVLEVGADANGEITADFDCRNFTPLFESLFRNTGDPLTNGTTDLYFSVILRLLDIGEDFMFTGVNFGACRLDIRARDKITCAFTCVGKFGEVAAAVPASGDITAPAAAPIVTASANVGTVTRNAAGWSDPLVQPLRGITLNIDGGPQGLPAVSTKYAIDILRSRLRINGTFDCYQFGSQNFQDNVDHAKLAFAIPITDGVGNGVTFTMPGLRPTDAGPDVVGTGQPVNDPFAFAGEEENATNHLMITADWLVAA